MIFYVNDHSFNIKLFFKKSWEYPKIVKRKTHAKIQYQARFSWDGDSERLFVLVVVVN